MTRFRILLTAALFLELPALQASPSNHLPPAEAGAELDAPAAPCPPPWPGLRTPVGRVLVFEEQLPPPSPQPAGARCGLGTETGTGWKGKPCAVLRDPSVPRQGPSLCVHPPLQHWQARCPKYVLPLLPLLSQCPLCLCLVSGCLDPPRLLVQVSIW